MTGKIWSVDKSPILSVFSSSYSFWYLFFTISMHRHTCNNVNTSLWQLSFVGVVPLSRFLLFGWSTLNDSKLASATLFGLLSTGRSDTSLLVINCENLSGVSCTGFDIISNWILHNIYIYRNLKAKNNKNVLAHCRPANCEKVFWNAVCFGGLQAIYCLFPASKTKSVPENFIAVCRHAMY